jgi:dipeptidyl-peptidase-4
MPQAAMPPHPGKDVAQLTAVEAAEKDHGVSAVQWLADGKSLVFNFHGELYQVVPGQTPRQLSESAAVQSAAIASPHSDQIAYVSAGELWVMDLAGDKPSARKLYAPGVKEVGAEAAYWSSDGSRLAFIETDLREVKERSIPDYLADETRVVAVKRAFPGEPSESRRIGFVSARGGGVQWASLPGSPLDLIFSVAWSPDGKALLVDSSDLYIKERRLLLVDPNTGRPRLLLREYDPHNVTAEWWADWAPNGKGVYFISDRDNDYHIYYQPLAGADGRPGGPKRVTSGDWAVFSAAVSVQARAMIFVANPGKPEERQTFRVPLTGGDPVRLSAQAGYHEPLISPDGRWIADIYSNDVTPPDLYLSDARRGESALRQVTHSPLPEFSHYRWVAAKYVQFPNVNDGAILHARLTLPPDFQSTKKYPAILGSVYSNTVHNRWGGRVFHPTWGLDQYLAQQGYVIMNVDISGSSGHGKLFRQRIREDYGGVDVEDLYSGVRYLIGEGFVDAQRVGIWGSSYGGLLTTMSLFKKPGVYRAGVAGAPATSLFHAETGEMRTMMAPQDHPLQYADSSAFLKSGGLQDHLMIIHGMKDDTVLFKDSITLTQRLILQGNDVDLVVLPGSPHGWDTEGLAQTRFAYHKLVDYFQRYLGEAAQP